MEKMKAMMETLRTHPPKELAGSPGDTQRSTVGRETPVHLPKSNVLEYRLANGDKVIVRPSGTEPKLKAYLSAKGDTKALSQERIEKLKQAVPGWLGI